MIKYSKLAKMILIASTGLAFKSCCIPGVSTAGAFPQSVTETHTKTTLVMPPSYATVAMTPPSLMQAPPVVQQPVMMSSPCASTYSAPLQAPTCPPSYQSMPCAPNYSSSYRSYMPPTYSPSSSYCSPPPAASMQSCYQTSGDSCSPNYTIAVPPPKQPTYTIAIPPSPPPTYQIAIPAQSGPTYNIQSPPQPLRSSEPCEPVQSHNPC